MFSAARTARRRLSPVGVVSAAARIFSSTYSARRATYSGSSPLRIGYRCPRISTGTTRPESDIRTGQSLVVSRSSLVLVVGRQSFVVGLIAMDRGLTTTD